MQTDKSIRPKTIGILAFTTPSMGGVWQYTKSMVEALASDSNNRYVVFCSEATEDLARTSLPIRVIDRKPPGKLQILMRLLYVAFGKSAPNLIPESERKLFEDIELFFSPENFFYPHLFLGKPYIYTLHDFQERYFPEFFSLTKRLTRRFVKRACATRATHILCESNCVKNNIIHFTGVDGEKVSVIPAPPLTALTQSAPQEECDRVRKTYSLPLRYLFYPAQFWPHKNHVRLLEAFQKIARKYPDLHLVLSGSKQNNQGAVIESMHRLGLEGRVRILGYVPYQDLKALYSMSQMLVMPTLFESVSIPIYEAFSLGVPVCASNVVALPEQVGDAGLLFDPTHPQDMAEKIQQILDNPELAETLRKRGRERIKGFNHAAYAAALVKVIDSISKEKASAQVSLTHVIRI